MSVPRPVPVLRIAGSILCACLAVPLAARAAEDAVAPQGSRPQDLRRLSIEELSQLDVTTASRRPENLLDAAAAVSVVQSDEIRRSGATSLPEAIRLADGVHAARLYGPSWAITTRGFNISTANKMLVLIDRRTVYSPLFSGVFWDAQSLLLDDVEQVEVTRGPGGSVWGANAVNGVINVITKSAEDTQGWLVKAAAGNELETLAGVRYGGRVGRHAFRVFGRFRAEDAHVFADGTPARDDARVAQAGFRIDSAAGPRGQWMLQGDVFRGRNGLFDRPATTVWNGYVLGRWTTTAAGDLQVQAYYDRGSRRVVNQFRATRDTADVDVQHATRIGGRHRLVTGGAARVSRGDDLGDGPAFFFDPRRRTQTVFSGFAQDEIEIRRSLFVTLGAKIETNTYTDVELQPTARVKWRAGDTATVWGAVSRAVRLPTRFDTDLRIRAPGSGPLLLTGSEDFESENVIAIEGGYRTFVAGRVSLDAAVYTNRYTDLRSLEAPETGVIPITLGNTLRARTAGLELSSSAQIADWWVMRGSYNYLWQTFSLAPDSRATSLTPEAPIHAAEANDPSHLYSFRSHLEFGAVELDAFVYGASRLPHPPLDGWTELDVRIGWALRPEWELSIVGQNLLRDRHFEFVAGTPLEAFERAVHLRSTWRY
jgi:iron complex outermembrane receptor protein